MTKRPPAQRAGIFITFEGTEGSGKSTQMRLLIERLQSQGYAVTRNQEPGGTEIGTAVRRILLDPQNVAMAPMTELLLMFASRAQAVAETIEPALNRGEIVVSDRFTDSSLAYQGLGRGLGFDTVWQLHRLALGSLLPQLTICLTVDVEQGLRRAHQRNAALTSEVSEARIDSQSLEFHQRVADAYARIAEREPTRVILIEGSGSIETVSERIWQLVSARLVPAVILAHDQR